MFGIGHFVDRTASNYREQGNKISPQHI